MKKVLVAVAVMASVSAFVYAQSSVTEPVASAIEMSAVEGEDDVYKDVKLEDLNQAVQTTINGYNDQYTVKSIGYNEEKKQTKVVLTPKDGAGDKEVILDDAGKEI